jgi:hypothetical protein
LTADLRVSNETTMPAPTLPRAHYGLRAGAERGENDGVTTAGTALP